MNSYPSYKDSGVEWIGEIPNHWKPLKVKNLFGFSKGKGLSKGSIEDDGNNECVLYGELFTRYKNLTSIENLESKTNDKTDVISEGNELLIPGSTTTTGIDLSNCKFLPKNGVLLGGDIIILKPIQYELNQIYYSHFLTNVSTPEFITGSRGVTIYHIYPKQIREIHTLLLPLAEQTQIVSFLDTKTQKIDELIEKTEQKIELLKEKRTSLINHCVTKGLNPNVKMKDSGVEWIGEIPKGWDSIPIKYILEKNKDSIKTGPFGSQLKSDVMVSEGIKIYNQRTVYDEDFTKGEIYITPEKYESMKGFTVLNGDILISSRGTIGKMTIVPNGSEIGVLHPCLIRLRVDTNLISKKYLWWYMNHSSLFIESVKFESNSTTIDVIYSNVLTEIRFPLPSIDEQTQIVKYLDEQTQKIDSTIEKETKRIALLKEYRQSLISEVVTGKIDVRDWKE